MNKLIIIFVEKLLKILKNFLRKFDAKIIKGIFRN